MEKEKIKINEDKLREEIEKTIRKAAGFLLHNMSGEIQLYGEVEDGKVIRFWTETFAGHNSCVQGEGIIALHTERWFDPLHNEYISEWFEGELQQNEQLKADFVEHLAKENEENDYGYDIYKPYMKWDVFANLHPEKWEDLQREWREIWLEHNVYDMVNEAIRRIEEEEEIELVNE